jgi:plastocyanin
MRFLCFAAMAGSLIFGATAVAADLSVQVRDGSGQGLKDAVVTFTPARGASVAGVKFPWPLRVAQQNMQFDPFVLVVPVGATVAFPNLDKVRHHVYSFSKPQPFELKLFGRDESRTVTFSKPGTIALGCNIHDAMLAFIKVVDTPYAIKTPASGAAVLHGVPSGPGTLKVWHPWFRSGLSDQILNVTIAGESVQQNVVLPVKMPVGHGH